MYSRSGTRVWPLALRLAEELVDLAPVEEQLAVPLRLVVLAVALLARRDVRADQPRLARLDAREASARFTLPARIDLISVPVSTRPASNVSSMVNSWRALRLRAIVLLMAHGSVPRWSERGGTSASVRMKARTPVPRTGVRLRLATRRVSG